MKLLFCPKQIGLSKFSNHWSAIGPLFHYFWGTNTRQYGGMKAHYYIDIVEGGGTIQGDALIE